MQTKQILLESFEHDKIIKLNEKTSESYYFHEKTRKIINEIKEELNKPLSVNLSNNRKIYDTDILDKVDILNLSGCINVKDVNKLINVKDLDIQNCKNISNVSMLNSIRKLNIQNCDKIKDIEMLISLSVLDISGCKKIKEVGNLKKITELAITEPVEGIHLLHELIELNIRVKIHSARNRNKVIVFKSNYEKIEKRVHKMNKNVDIYTVKHN